MDSGDDTTSSESSASDTKPRPVGGASGDEVDGMVYFPPHFPQQTRGSGSDFSPHSDTSEDESTSSDEEHTEAPPIRTYAPPPMLSPDNSESGSGMEMGPSCHVRVPYECVPVRCRPVSYKQFYGEEDSGSSSGSEEETVGWKTRRKV